MSGARATKIELFTHFVMKKQQQNTTKNKKYNLKMMFFTLFLKICFHFLNFLL